MDVENVSHILIQSSKKYKLSFQIENEMIPDLLSIHACKIILFFIYFKMNFKLLI